MHLRRAVLIPLLTLIAVLTAGCTPAERAAFARWYTAGVNSAPVPVSDHRCPPGPIAQEIQHAFGFAAPWAESIAWRESNCRPDPPHNNPSRGLFQFQGHQDLLRAACPQRDPAVSVYDAHCAIRAAKLLYDAQGIAPWRL